MQVGSEPESHGDALVISCDDCVMQHTDACDDCLVSFILNRDPGDAVVIDADEARALRMLAHVGLVPGTRHVRRVG
jgi:Zn-finger protein